MVIGIDEVGRGALAGPLVVGAVALNKPIEGLKDSKLLPKSKRLLLSDLIIQNAAFVSLGWVWPEEIDSLGLTGATTLALKRAISNAYKIDKIIIDGNYNYLDSSYSVETLVKADNLIPSVSAASIVAKVARDNYMTYIDALTPNYGFKNHVGYGTKEHFAALRRYGPSPLHRLSFKPCTASSKTSKVI